MLVNVYNQGEKLYLCNDFYVPVEDPNEWLPCPKCGLKPLIWIFDNGCYTACGCGDNVYEHFSIRAESICSYLDRRDTYSNKRYNNFWPDEYAIELKENWNIYCETGDTEVFNRKRAKILEEQGIKIW